MRLRRWLFFGRFKFFAIYFADRKLFICIKKQEVREDGSDDKMGSNFSMGWLAPKEDLGPWGGGQGQADSNKEPISLVLTERVFERWAQVHQDRVAGAAVGLKSLPKPGFVEDELSTEIGVGVVCDDIPGITGTAAAAGQEVMEGYQGQLMCMVFINIMSLPLFKVSYFISRQGGTCRGYLGVQ